MEQFDSHNMIYAYTRKKAIDEGVLVDISDTARNYGFVIPVAITATLLDSYVKPTEELEELGQSWVLHMPLFLLAIIPIMYNTLYMQEEQWKRLLIQLPDRI